MAVAKQLYELQEIDTDSEHARQTLDMKSGKLGKKDELDAAREALAVQQKALDDLKHQRKDAETELGDTNNKIAEAEKQLYGGRITNPKELGNLQHEINMLKTASDKLETKTLEIIDRAEKQDKTVAAAITDFQQLEAASQKEQGQLTADVALLKQALEGLAEKRRQLVAQIDPAAIVLYERIRRQKKPAVAKVEQGICRACRLSLSASALQKARGGQPVQCTTCGRILFIS